MNSRDSFFALVIISLVIANDNNSMKLWCIQRDRDEIRLKWWKRRGEERIKKARRNADKFHNISSNSIDFIERDTIFPRFTSMKIHLYESISNMTTFFSYFYLFIRFFVPFAWAWFRNCDAKRILSFHREW